MFVPDGSGGRLPEGGHDSNERNADRRWGINSLRRKPVLLGAIYTGVAAAALTGTTEILKLTEGSHRTDAIQMPSNFLESPVSQSGDRVFVGPMRSADRATCGGTRFMPRGAAKFILDNGQYKAVARLEEPLPSGEVAVRCAAPMSRAVSWLPVEKGRR